MKPYPHRAVVTNESILRMNKRRRKKARAWLIDNGYMPALESAVWKAPQSG